MFRAVSLRTALFLTVVAWFTINAHTAAAQTYEVESWTPKEEKISLHLDAGLQTNHHAIHLQTDACMQFIDITDSVIDRVRRSGIRNGFVNVQTKHTTTAIIVNEHEPLLLEDMRQTLDSVLGGIAADA